jgi:hypothetical protein
MIIACPMLPVTTYWLFKPIYKFYQVPMYSMINAIVRLNFTASANPRMAFKNIKVVCKGKLAFGKKYKFEGTLIVKGVL